jgi:hypothetical protein
MKKKAFQHLMWGNNAFLIHPGFALIQIKSLKHINHILKISYDISMSIPQSLAHPANLDAHHRTPHKHNVAAYVPLFQD